MWKAAKITTKEVWTSKRLLLQFVSPPCGSITLIIDIRVGYKEASVCIVFLGCTDEYRDVF